MDYEQAKIWIDVAQFLAMGSIGVWMYLERRNDKAHERISALETNLEAKLDNQSGRLMKVETQVVHLPTQDDIGKLYERMRNIDQRISHIEGQFIGANHTLNLIHEYLMKERP